MKKSRGIAVILFLSILMACETTLAWQGRMAGMGDPFGLVEDESDFLIHPAKIANGDTVRYYGDYRFTWDGVTDWNHSRNDGSSFLPQKASGDQFTNNAMIGTALPWGPGRMGVFFKYEGTRGSFDGQELESVSGNLDTFKLKGDFDQFAFKVLYGLPVCNYKVGVEAEVAYRTEENKTDFLLNQGGGNFLSIHDIIFGRIFEPSNTLPYMLPYDSNFWETNLKGSFDGNIYGAQVSLTGHGGFLFAGSNRLDYHSESVSPTGLTPFENVDFRGDASGWQAGGDLFIRVPLCPNLWMPLLVRVNYMEKDKDGSGVGAPGTISEGLGFIYKDNYSDFRIQAGGGLDRNLGGGARIAGGLYYNYIKTRIDYDYNVFAQTGNLVQISDYIPYPNSREHQLLARLVGEQQMSPTVSLRGGVSGFYGWLHESFDFLEGSPVDLASATISHIPLDGTHWGIGASAGGTIKYSCYTLEPFIGGGYQHFDVNGAENRISSILNMDLSKNNAFVTTGLSIKF